MHRSPSIPASFCPRTALVPLGFALLAGCAIGETAPDPAVESSASGVCSAPPQYTNLTTALPGEWPKFKRDLGNHGVAEGAGCVNPAAPATKWMTKMTGDAVPGTASGRNNSGPLIATIGGIKTVFVSVRGGCNTAGTCWSMPSDDSLPHGMVYAVNGVDGTIRWQTELDVRSGPGFLTGSILERLSADIYAPTLADVDGDCRRELIVNASDGRYVFAIRTETDATGAAGTIKWIHRFERESDKSEAAPAVVDIDGDGRMDVLIGVDGGPNPARYYALNGADGTLKGHPFQESSTRADRDLALRQQYNKPYPLGVSCANVNKLDSSSPMVDVVEGKPTIFAGSWSGFFYGLQWTGDPQNGSLVAAYQHDLGPALDGGDCIVRKVRSGAVSIPTSQAGYPEILFGHMKVGFTTQNPLVLGDQNMTDFRGSELRVLLAGGGQFTPIRDLTIPGWKSTPSAIPAAPGSSASLVAGGSVYGGYFLSVDPSLRKSAGGGVTTNRVWGNDGTPSNTYGDGDGDWGGNRSSPAFANIAGTGEMMAVLGVEGADRPGLAFFSAATGALRGAWSPPASAPAPGPSSRPASDRLPFYGVASGPAVGNIDGDAALEIVTFGLDGVLYAIDGTCQTP
ncbi:MAG: VCBS repeat-containing protein [Byssovorax sp.]